ncbi:hypothetical protein HAX54_034484, partial [Datura stramonium]|nr:hypothetical protein [Datura stramonium]
MRKLKKEGKDIVRTMIMRMKFLTDPQQLQKGKARELSSERVVDDPRNWKIIKDGRFPQVSVGNKGEVLVNNMFDVLNKEEDETNNTECPTNDNEQVQDSKQIEMETDPTMVKDGQGCRAVKSARKGKMQGTEDTTQLIRVQPKRK